MKMENTSENKAKFFAIYYRQKVMKTDQTSTILCDPVAIGHGDWYLELTPLSQITDEDAIEVAKIINKYYSGEMDSCTSNIKKWAKMYVRSSYMIGNFLISRGYYVGDGIEIEYGWVKIKDNL